MTPVRLDVDVVVPTVGRASLGALLADLVAEVDPHSVVVVDDRPAGGALEALQVPDAVAVVRSGGRGPAAARNAGWRHGTSAWVVFVDDDVRLPAGWGRALRRDLAGAGDDVASVRAAVDVPLPADRRPTDWERNVARLADGYWVTAEVALRRRALAAVGGFDERFRTAYREDTDLALRLLDAGWRLERGQRVARHPVRPASRWVSVRLQRGNAADPLLSAAHGPDWRRRIGEPPGAYRRHRRAVAAAAVATAAAAARRWPLAAAGAAVWAWTTGRFAAERIAPGPRTAEEVATMLATSALIPPVAVYHRARGQVLARAGAGQALARSRARSIRRLVDLPAMRGSSTTRPPQAASTGSSGSSVPA
jgi:hypothetical protein